MDNITEIENILDGYIYGKVSISYRGHGKLYIMRPDTYQPLDSVVLIHPEFSMEITEIPFSAPLEYIAGFIHGVLIASGALNVRVTG